MARARQQPPSLTLELYQENVCELIYQVGKSFYLHGSYKEDFNPSLMTAEFDRKLRTKESPVTVVFDVERLSDFAKDTEIQKDDKFYPYHQIFSDLGNRARTLKPKYDRKFRGDTKTSYYSFSEASVGWARDNAEEMEKLFLTELRPLTQHEIWERDMSLIFKNKLEP